MDANEELLDADAIAEPGRPWARWACLGASLVLAAALVSQLRPVLRLLRGEADLTGRRLYVPTHAVDRETLEGLDLARVHAELLTQWVVIAARRQRGRAADEDEAAAFAELVEAIAPDPNLLELATALREVVREGLGTDPERALYLTWAWSRYLETHEQPWLLHGHVHSTRHGAMFGVAAYVVVDEAVVAVGVRDQRVRAVRRVDGINLREGFLGATTRDDPVAIVSMDRVEELATRELWPLLGPAADPTASRSAFADAIRTEVTRALGHTHASALERTAWARAALLETIDQIHARAVCGSRFRIHLVPRVGFSDERLERLRHFAASSRSRCPSITPLEVDRLTELSQALHDGGPALERALVELTQWAAEMVGVHEARHLADAESGADFEGGVPCPGCPSATPPATRNELSGYLAALAWSGAPATTLYQACRATSLDPFGPHVEAMALIEAHSGVPCTAPPPSDLTDRARALERTLLGRSDPIAVIHSFSSLAASP